MRCRVCKRKLTLYALGELSSAQRRDVEKHLEQCSRCRQQFRELERLAELLLPVSTTTRGRDLWPAVAARIEAQQRQEEPTRRRAWRPLAAAAGAVAAVVLIVALTGRPQIPVIENGFDADMWMADTMTSVVWDDPWAGDVAQALELALAEEA